MPLCIICNSRYYRQTWDSPAEPCDCGANYDREAWQDDDSGPSLAERRDAWARGEAQASNDDSVAEPQPDDHFADS